jgi:hypothetical protein
VKTAKPAIARITSPNSLPPPKKSPSWRAASSATTIDMSSIPRKAKAVAMLRYLAGLGRTKASEASAGIAAGTIQDSKAAKRARSAFSASRAGMLAPPIRRPA